MDKITCLGRMTPWEQFIHTTHAFGTAKEIAKFKMSSAANKIYGSCTLELHSSSEPCSYFYDANALFFDDFNVCHAGTEEELKDFLLKATMEVFLE